MGHPAAQISAASAVPVVSWPWALLGLGVLLRLPARRSTQESGGLAGRVRPHRNAGATERELLRSVRLTARTSAMLFSSAQLAPLLAGRSGDRLAPPLYRGFLVAHAVHFAALSRYAVRTGGHDLFPGGRSVQDVGGWPTVAAIMAAFGGLAAAGRMDAAATGRDEAPWASAARRTIGAMYTGTYVGKVANRSRWFVVPAAITAWATVACTRGRCKAGSRPPTARR